MNEPNGDSVTPAEVDAALAVLSEHFEMVAYSKVALHLWEGQTPQERAEGIKAMQAADEMAEQRARIIVADAIRAARAARQIDGNQG